MALPVAAAGVGMQAYGMYEQGQEAAARGRLIKGSSDYEASQFELQGQQQKEYLERQSARTQGRNETTEAAGNVDITQGSPALAILDQVAQDQKAIAVTVGNAQHRALAARMAGIQGEAYGGQAGKAGTIGATGGLLTGAADLYGKTSRGSSSSSDSGPKGEYAGPDEYGDMMA